MHLTYKQSFYDYHKAYFRFLIEKCNQIKMGYMLPLCAYYWEGSTFKMADLSDCKTKRNSESFLRHFFTAAICQSKCESQLSQKTNENRNIFTLWPEFRSHCDSQFQMNTLIEYECSILAESLSLLINLYQFKMQTMKKPWKRIMF